MLNFLLYFQFFSLPIVFVVKPRMRSAELSETLAKGHVLNFRKVRIARSVSNPYVQEIPVREG